MGGKSTPAPPDYAAAAEATAAGDLENARYATLANRPDIYTPTYSQTWAQGTGETFDQSGYDAALAAYRQSLNSPPQYSNPVLARHGITTPGPAPVAPNRADFTSMSNPDQWVGTQTLTPEQQRIFNENQSLQLSLGQLGNQAAGSVGNLFGTTYATPGSVPDYQGPAGQLDPYGQRRQAVQDAMLARVNTDISRDRDAKSSQLIAQGIPQGSEAWNREMEQIDRQLTDARQQAEIAATQQATQDYGADIAGRSQMGQEGMAQFNTGLEGLRQQIQNALLERQTPLNEISAFRTGSQVNMPQFQPYGQQQFTGGPDLLGAAQSTYQAQLANANAQNAGKANLMNGLFSLGGAALMAPVGTFS